MLWIEQGNIPVRGTTIREGSESSQTFGVFCRGHYPLHQSDELDKGHFFDSQARKQDLYVTVPLIL